MPPEAESHSEREFRGNPLSARTYPNAYFVPAGIVSYEDLVYDEAGALVEASATWRRMSGGWISNPPRSLPSLLRNQADAQIVQGDHLFLGRFNEIHYGHWLTEGVARLWVLLGHGDEVAVSSKRIVTSARMNSLKEWLRPWVKPQSNHWRSAVNAFGLHSDRFTVATRPVRVARITVPEPSMMMEESLHPCHLQVCQTIGRSIIKGPMPSGSSRQAVYLSRVGLSRQGLRTYAGEQMLEVELQRLGVRVVRPESLRLNEQIALFTAHSTFIGTWGSAFHSLLLRQRTDPVTCVYLINRQTSEADLAVRTNYVLIDELMGNRVHGIRCLSLDPFGGMVGTLDVEIAVGAIRTLLNDPEG